MSKIALRINLIEDAISWMIAMVIIFYANTENNQPCFHDVFEFVMHACIPVLAIQTAKNNYSYTVVQC